MSDEIAAALIEIQTTVVLERDGEVLVAEVGQQGPPGSASLPSPVRVAAPAGASRVIESVDAALYRAVKWIVTVTNPATGACRLSEVLALNDGIEARHVQYALFGAHFDVAVTASLAGGSLALGITNHEGVDLLVDAVRVGNILI